MFFLLQIMARVLRNFRYRTLPGLFFQENVPYLTLLDSILALDDEFHKFPDSSVPSLQTLCIKCVVRRSKVLFEPYVSCSAEQLLDSLPPGPFDGLPPPLCDLLCDLLLSLREPESTATPLYCVISPYSRCLSLREPTTEVAAAALETLLVARVRHLAELTWTGAPLTQGLVNYLAHLPALTTLITEEPVDPADVRELLLRCPALRTLMLRDGGCVTALADLGVNAPQLRDLRLLVDPGTSLDLVTLFSVFPGLEKLCVKRTSWKCPWYLEEVDISALEKGPLFDDLKELSVEGCDTRGVLKRPFKTLAKLTLERCEDFLEDLARQPLLNSLSMIHCNTATHLHSLRSYPDFPLPVVNVKSLQLQNMFGLTTALWLSPLIFPRVRRLLLDGDVRIVPSATEFDDLRELHYSYENPVKAEQVLSELPLSQLEKLSLNYQTDDGTPLALGTLSRCSRLVELQLEGISDLSVPQGLKLPSVRQLRLRGGSCSPVFVQWLIDTLPGLRCVQLVEMTLDSSVWTSWFRDWRRDGIEVELEGGCTILPWRRSGIRRHAPAI